MTETRIQLRFPADSDRRGYSTTLIREVEFDGWCVRLSSGGNSSHRALTVSAAYKSHDVIYAVIFDDDPLFGEIKETKSGSDVLDALLKHIKREHMQRLMIGLFAAGVSHGAEEARTKMRDALGLKGLFV